MIIRRMILNKLFVFQATYDYGPVDADYNKRVVRCISEFANRATRVMHKFDSLPKVLAHQTPWFLPYTHIATMAALVVACRNTL